MAITHNSEDVVYTKEEPTVWHGGRRCSGGFPGDCFNEAVQGELWCCECRTKRLVNIENTIRKTMENISRITGGKA